MKKTLACLLAFLLVSSPVFAWRRGSTWSEGNLYMDKNQVDFDEVDATPGNPDTDRIKVYAKDNGSGTTEVYALDSAGTETSLMQEYAPLDATYITQTANGSLSAEQALGSLATGILKNTTTTGVLSIAVADTDYDSSITNEINTITADDANTTSGLAITVAGGGINATAVVGDTVTITGTEADTLDSVTGRGATTTNAITVGNIQSGADGADGKLTLYAEQATDYTASLNPNSAMTSNADFYLPADEPGGTYLLNMTTGGVMGFDSADYISTAELAAASNNTEVLFNASDVITGDAQFTYNSTTDEIQLDSVSLENGAVLDNASDNIVTLTENSDTLSIKFPGTAISFEPSGTGVTELVFNNDNADMDVRIASSASVNNFYSDGGISKIYSGASASTSTENYTGVGYSGRIQAVQGGNGSFTGVHYGTTAAYGASLHLAKSNNASVGSHTVLSSGDSIGEVLFESSDGTNFEPSAGIVAFADATQGDNDVPGRLCFYTTLDGTATLVERLKIDKDGLVTFIQNSDMFTLTGDGSDWYQKWSDGYLYLQSDEGTNTTSYVEIKGKGTGGAVLVLDDGSNASYQSSILQSDNNLLFAPEATGSMVFNSGNNDVDVRFDGATNDNILRIDGGTEQVIIKYTSLTAGDFGIVDGGTDDSAYFNLETYSDQATWGNAIAVRKSHNDTLGTKTATIDNEYILQLLGYGVDSGSNWDLGAGITIIQDGAAGTKIPTEMIFETHSSSVTNSDLLFLDSDGQVGIGLEPTQDFHVADSNNAGNINLDTFDDGSVYSTIYIRKSDTDTLGTAIQTDDDDSLGAIVFQGVSSSSAFSNAGYIYMVQDGASGASQVPGEMILTTNSSSGTNANQLFLDGPLGNVFVNQNTNYNTENYGGTAFNNKFQVANVGNGGIGISQWSTTATYGATLHLSRSNNGSVGTYTALDNGDCIGEIGFLAADGTTFEPAASIVAFADGVQGADDVPSRIELRTTPDGAALPLERVKLDSIGDLYFEGATDDGNYLHFDFTDPTGSRTVTFPDDDVNLTNLKKISLMWFIEGTVATGTEQGATIVLPYDVTVEDIELHVKTAPTGANLIVDINDGGTTIYSTNPEIDATGTTEDGNEAMSDTSIAAGAEITLDIDQVGSTVAGADLTVILECKR